MWDLLYTEKAQSNGFLAKYTVPPLGPKVSERKIWHSCPFLRIFGNACLNNKCWTTTLYHIDGQKLGCPDDFRLLLYVAAKRSEIYQTPCIPRLIPTGRSPSLVSNRELSISISMYHEVFPTTLFSMFIKAQMSQNVLECSLVWATTPPGIS